MKKLLPFALALLTATLPLRAQDPVPPDAPDANPDAAPAVPAPPANVQPWRLSSAQLRGLVGAVLAQQAQRLARLGGLSDRARVSAWLPELKFRAGRNTDQTLRLTPTTEDPDRWALSGGSGLRLEGELRWQFDRLVFASEEVPIERMRLVLEQQRQRGILDLLDWVFRWQVAVMQQSDPDLSASKRLQAQLTAEQTAGAIDVLSGGWFSAHVSSASTSASER